MTPALLIKIFQPADITPLWSLVRDGQHQTEEQYFEKALVEQDENKRMVFVARETEGGPVVAYVHYNRFPGYSPFRRFGVPEIQDLYVHPDHRRKGFGSQLLKRCEEQARADGQTEIGIGVGVMSNFGDAQRLYIRNGFLPDGAGAVYDREALRVGEVKALDDRLCLMMTKSLA